MVAAIVYIEGGGRGQTLRTELRKGFRAFFDKAGLQGRISNIVRCGSRAETIKKFCTALRGAARDKFVCLLVDSDGPVAANTSPWAFLGNRPAGANDDNAHLMVQCMEAWFLTDKEALERFFGQGFRRNALPNRGDVETIPKRDVFTAIERATCDCTPKGHYRKGSQSFEVLATLDPDKVAAASPYAHRLFETLRQKTQGTEL